MKEKATPKALPQGVSYSKQSAHWGEIIQGPVETKGKVVTALITLPRSDRYTVARFFPERGAELSVTPSYATKALLAVRNYLNSLGYADMGGRLTLESNIRVGCGSGSSTCDIIASLKAAASSLRVHPNPTKLQQLCWEIEKASDPLALGSTRPVLYASRCGKLLKTYSRALPRLMCLGFDTSSTKTVSTEELARNESYSPSDLQQFRKVLAVAETAIAKSDAALLAEAATSSAILNQPRVAIHAFDEILKSSLAVGAFGVSCSHSGTVASALFLPETPSLETRFLELQRELSGLGCNDFGAFEVGESVPWAMTTDSSVGSELFAH